MNDQTASTASQPERILKVRGLKRVFGNQPVHKNVSFDLHKNEFLALMGTSGGGKSLVLRSIVGLDRPDAGQIWFENRDLTRLSEREFYHVRCRIGYVFQEGALFDSLTVEENLRYPLMLHTNWSGERIHEEVNRRLEEADLSGTNLLYPSQLSGGMQKRIGLLRATMLHPSVALVDEPTAGLDPPHIKRFVETATQVKSTVSVSALLVTHDIDVAFALCDRIAILNEGVIHAIGSIDEMDRSQDPIVRRILHPDIGGKRRRAA
jgi:phospholipid/cholesterol/gamma-HCH transport system ATP-binding protein